MSAIKSQKYLTKNFLSFSYSIHPEDDVNGNAMSGRIHDYHIAVQAVIHDAEPLEQRMGPQETAQ